MAEPYRVHSRDGRLVAQFVWRGDRFAQQFLLDGLPLGNSVEGDGEAAWPPSPPIQQLSAETIGEQPVLLGVGGAGRGHWSVSVAACADHPTAICFELACRCQQPTEFLGSTLHLTPPLAVIAIDGHLQRDAETVTVRAADDANATTRWSLKVVASPTSSPHVPDL
jgi:hypothetical protein